MKWLYVSTLCGAVIFMLFCFFYSMAKTKKNVLEKPIRRIMIFTGASITANLIAVLMTSKTVALVFYALYHCFLDALGIALLYYVRQYTGIPAKSRHGIKVMGVAALVDCALLLSNPFTGIVYNCVLITGKYGNFWKVTDRGFLFLCHLVVIYSFIVISFITLIKKASLSPAMYKIKYITVAFIVGIAMSMNVTYINLNFNFDGSLLCYALMAFAVYYFSILYIPRGLMEKLLFFTIANMKDGIICIDIDGKCVHFNKNADIYCDAYNDFQAVEEQASDMLSENVNEGMTEATWESVRRVDGQMHHYTIEYKSIFDNHRYYLGCFFIIHDHTEETNKFAAEKYRATHDMLTGVYNKEYFCETSKKMILANPDTAYYIICSDVKNFKLVNDIFGVEAGDNLLKKIAALIQEITPEYCIYGRLSSDRFAVCIPKKIFNESALLKHIHKVDSLPENSSFKVHIHIGVYEVTDPNLRVSVMCDRANLAIRTIKDSYQNIVAYYNSHLREDFINEQKVISEFENALKTKQFKAYVQPQITADGRINGGEVLVRWLHPDGIIPPYKFIEIFEQTGLISRLDSYMWELACIQLDKWNKEGRTNYYLSVNISQKDFYLLDVYEVITSLVTRYNINPRSLHLEITETAIMNNPAVQLKLISRLREFGFLIEIDDFGSGYSSLNTLKDLTADVLKIDMGFLKHTENREERSKTILRMIISLAKSLDMEVITEGVETKEQVNFLTEFGCDIFQGYFFAKPMPVEEFEEKYLSTYIEV